MADAKPLTSISKFIAVPDDCLLVTGSNGFIGSKVVQTLLEYGFVNLRCFVRPASKLARLEGVLKRSRPGRHVELIAGDLLSRDDCRKAVAGVSIIYHLAAGIEKSFAGAFMNSALATRNLIEAFLERGQPKRFVNISSFAVYSNRKMKRGSLLDENSPLEDAPQARHDAYGFGKSKQEEIVREYGESQNLPYVILRPGAVFGCGNPALSGRVGINTFGFFIHLGGSNRLPLTFVDNCAEAIVLAGITPGVDSEVFNVVDNELPTSKEFLQAYRQKVNPFFALPVPYPLAYAFSLLWEKYSAWSQGQLPPVFNRRRCAAEWKGNRYTNQKLKEKLGWEPRINMSDAMSAFLSQFN
ncbi:MAG TPA: NAD(P)-dependent oxidoreductase [Candidatus Sulfopaludibacter sp.]|nr:NAD(P)-dependent oxidoreductase [Candidatus Sulfopaludibacter sp.]